MIDLPKEFCQNCSSLLGEEEAQRLFEALNADSTLALRSNPFKQVPEWKDAEAIPWSEGGIYLAERPSFTLDPAFHSGAYYVQEASSHFVGHVVRSLFDSPRGLRILDACAAPGGKTTLYASLVGREGLVVASEQNRSRASVLADNVRKWGLGNVLVVAAGAEAHSETQSIYDVVAVDAPCSGEGMFRKMEGAREEWTPQNVELCAERQASILQDVWAALKPGGVLIYSTCTFNQRENEQCIERFIEDCDGEVGEANEIATDPAWGIVSGWVGAAQTFRFMPHKTRGEGLFVAVLKKSYDASGGAKIPRARRQPFEQASKAENAECLRWLDDNEGKGYKIAKIGEQFYAYHPAQWEFSKKLSEYLNVIYSGVCLGEIFKKKLSPDPALAFFVGLDKEATESVQLNREDALLFLSKSPDLSVDLFAEGFNLACDERGNGLGFVKRIGARLNNRYPNSLRIINFT